ncbi:MAG: PEP-CTERM sorting domain-containing protein [Pirellulales bacterium]|nr:PEP-CTERM sorting domain-containing protein [Pirellulales bacterium]
MTRFSHWAWMAALLIAGSASGAPVLLSDVPAYDWYHGCSPTAAGSVMGYYDMHGRTNMFTASGWDNVKLTVNVQDQISSPAHNAKYDPTPDDASLPVPPNTSIACFLQTSMDPRGYGSTSTSQIPYGLAYYSASRGYGATAWSETYILGLFGFTWSDLRSEINAGRPMLFSVDSDGDGDSDHSIPVFGYDDRGSSGKYYACYTTWSEAETVAWYKFRGVGNVFGINKGHFLHLDGGGAAAAGGGASLDYLFGEDSDACDVVMAPAAVPEPSSIGLLGAGLFGLSLVFLKRLRG